MHLRPTAEHQQGRSARWSRRPFKLHICHVFPAKKPKNKQPFESPSSPPAPPLRLHHHPPGPPRHGERARFQQFVSKVRETAGVSVKRRVTSRRDAIGVKPVSAFSPPFVGGDMTRRGGSEPTEAKRERMRRAALFLGFLIYFSERRKVTGRKWSFFLVLGCAFLKALCRSSAFYFLKLTEALSDGT